MENLKFSGESPVVINFNGSADDIYAPVKTSSCDINIVDEHILDDLYTAKKDEIEVVVERLEPRKIWQNVMVSRGNVVSSRIVSSLEEYYKSYERDLFFTDVNGDYRFNGILENVESGSQVMSTLKYNHNTKKWERNEDWNLVYSDHYFYYGPYSYRVYWDGSSHMVQEWDSLSDDWGPASVYTKLDDETVTDCAYGAENIIHFMDGTTQLIFGQKNYFWYRSQHRWELGQTYTDDEGEFLGMYGKHYMRVKNRNGELVDAIYINGYSAHGVTQSEWIAKIEPEDNTFTLLIPAMGYDPDRYFSDLHGDVYYVGEEGIIYVWSWDVNSWCEWITFEGDYSQYSFQLDYKIPGTTPTTCEGMCESVVIRYYDNEDKYFVLSDIEAPEFERQEVIIPDTYTIKTIWDGYKMPNTYSQDLTQNLDAIAMTAIDPISILKWVTVDKLFTKPNVETYRDIIGKAIAYVKLDDPDTTDSTQFWVERSVTYGSGDYTGDNGLLDLKIQVSNFWNENGDPANVYDVISEMLKPFCLTLAYINRSFQIYNANKTYGNRTFDKYWINSIGELTPIIGSPATEEKSVFDFDEGDWISNNVESAKIDINTTYDKVTGVANTCAPSYSKTVKDVVNFNDKDSYSYTGFNVQRNKTKGYEYRKGKSPAYMVRDDDQWFYIWNGVYTNPDFNLVTRNVGTEVYPSEWSNINNAETYVTGSSGYVDGNGNIYNFYGGSNNPTGTGKTQDPEKSVDMKDRVTYYWIDNGTVPDFLEDSDLVWSFTDPIPGQQSSNPRLVKQGKTASKYGEELPGTTWPSTLDRIELAYHQEYDNVTLKSTSEQNVDLDLTQSYSRTGVDVEINNMTTTNVTNKVWRLNWANTGYIAMGLENATVKVFPQYWDSEKVYVDNKYFNRYEVGDNNLISPVWDRRMVTMYVELEEDPDWDPESGEDPKLIRQFNGRDWVADTEVRAANSFYLIKLMNYQKLFNEDYQYNIIEFTEYVDEQGNTVPLEDYSSNKYTSRRRYSLEDEDVVFYTDGDGAVRKKPRNNIFVTDKQHKYTPYYSDDREWYIWVKDCDPGKLSITLPLVDSVNAKVVVDISCSSLIGESSSHFDSNSARDIPVLTNVTGHGIYNGNTITLTSSNCINYGKVLAAWASIDFVPYNAAYVKAEHLDINVSLSDNKSNVGQMFSQADIKYTSVGYKNYLEEYSDLNFKVNTKNILVSDSYSYLLYDNELADPGSFVINGFSARPEAYAVQAYMNWLTRVRKIYSKTLLPKKEDGRDFSSVRTFITTPEIDDDELLVVSDTWDVKSNRHTITAVDDYRLEVDWVDSVSASEVPRMARSDRWNLPTAYKL